MPGLSQATPWTGISVVGAMAAAKAANASAGGTGAGQLPLARAQPPIKTSF